MVRRRLSTRALTVIFSAGVCLAVTTSGAARSGGPDAQAAVPPIWVTTATTQLAALSTKASASMTGYTRARFGAPWKDVDVNGCDTRNDILRRDLKDEIFKQGSTCIVQRGRLKDPYTGKVILFKRGKRTSSAVQIDHVVALGNAWRSGAAGWAGNRRLRYANDPVVLLAVDGPTNGAKSDKDASKWLPTRLAYHCRYVAKQIKIKAKYALWVTAAERAQMATLLANCPG
jgi:hypothetical protein